MKERKAPNGFDDLAEHDEMLALQMRIMTPEVIRQIPKGHNPGKLCLCCGVGPAGFGDMSNIMVARDIKPEGYAHTTGQFTILDKESGPFQILWRNP